MDCDPAVLALAAAALASIFPTDTARLKVPAFEGETPCGAQDDYDDLVVWRGDAATPLTRFARLRPREMNRIEAGLATMISACFAMAADYASLGFDIAGSLQERSAAIMALDPDLALRLRQAPLRDAEDPLRTDDRRWLAAAIAGSARTTPIARRLLSGRPLPRACRTVTVGDDRRRMPLSRLRRISPAEMRALHDALLRHCFTALIVASEGRRVEAILAPMRHPDAIARTFPLGAYAHTQEAPLMM